MTVGELKELLDGLDDDVDVRLAMQPSWPFEYSIGTPVIIGNPENEDGESVLYLPEERQTRYLPKEVCDELGW
jgi:hypothetical protein